MKCTFCDQPAILYLQRFQGRRKAQSYPVCGSHSTIAWAYEQFAQDSVRDLVGWALPVKKGSIPRFKISLKP